MPTQVTVHDQTSSGQETGELVLDLLTERITVRELIRSRVYQEVHDYNRKTQGPFKGLVQPTEAEAELNRPRTPRTRTIDWHRQYEVAIEAFEGNRFLVLVNDRQVADLDQELVLTPETHVAFLRLVPLVGG